MLIDRIKNLTKEDYSRAYKELEAFCLKNTNLLLYGEFGNASFPSISDLDVFICLKENYFCQDRDRIIEFIDSDEIRKYLFFHDPLIISESVLPYIRKFHTCYNLKFTYQSIVFPDEDKESLGFLNSIWATYIMGIGPEILINQKYSIRDKLLVLKNICQSIVNINPNSDALNYSEKIRQQAVYEGLSDDIVNAVFEDKLRELYNVANILEINDLIVNEPTNKKTYRISNNRIIKMAKLNNFHISDTGISIELNSKLFQLFIDFNNLKSSSSVVQNYIDRAVKLNEYNRKMSFDYPFITPFGFQFYRSDFKALVKKILISIGLEDAYKRILVNFKNS